MKLQKLLALFLSCLILCQANQAQTQTTAQPAAPSGEEARVARLAGLAKVWGAVKFFHPYLAYREIDWDKALIETLPKVNSARSAQEYQAAVNQMLAVLNDRSTRADIGRAETPAADQEPAADQKSATANDKLVRSENGVVVIDGAQIATAVAKDNSAMNRLVTNITQASPNATGIIIDARSSADLTEIDLYYFGVFMRQALAAVLDTTVNLGSTRYRQHNGYATQASSGASFYSSALVTTAPQTIQGQSKTKTPPIVFLVNEHSPSFADILSGLQLAGRAVVIQDGERAPDSGGGAMTIKLPDNVNVRIRTTELINPDGSVDLQPDSVVTSTGKDAAFTAAMRAVRESKTGTRPNRPVPPFTSQLSEKDKPYTDMEFPAVEYRLLALFRFWNVINYFFPYKKHIEDAWENVLPRYIPKFETNKDAVDYQMTVREMVAEIHDSHGGTRNANISQDRMGRFQPAIFVGYIEEKSVITKVLDDKLPIKVGDVILTIDGEPVEKRRESLARYIASSTPQWLMRLVHFRLLFGPKDSVVNLRVQGADNQVREVALPRSQSIMDPKLATVLQRTTPMIEVLPNGFGYVDLARLPAGDVDKMFDTIKNTPAVIFDMRGYPNGTAWPIAPRLTEKKTPVAALFSRPILEANSMSDSEVADSASYSFAQKIPERQGDVYRGKVVVLINEDAISQAEHTCLFFESATDVTFIGTPTAGANGDVTFMVLPGNLVVSFSGHDVRHADGRQLQRVGIQPAIRVAPTIRGTIEGRDEILERAIKYLGETRTLTNRTRP
jgi:C-terminal processing protease CtpA/Prc